MYYFIPYKMAVHHEAELATVGFSIKRYIPVSVEDVSRVAAALEDLRVLCPNGAKVLFGRPFMEYRIGDLQNGDTLVLAHGNQFAIVRYETNNAQPSEAPTPPMDEMAKARPIKKQHGMAEDAVPPMEMNNDMVFCRGCGKEINATARFCPDCGAPQTVVTAPKNDMVFCRGCGKEINVTALFCPDCGAPQTEVTTPKQALRYKSTAAAPKNTSIYRSYDQVPWYRKNWCAILCFLVFLPGVLLILLSGDVYYEKKGKLKTYSTGAKIALIVIYGLFFIRIFF